MEQVAAAWQSRAGTGDALTDRGVSVTVWIRVILAGVTPVTCNGWGGNGTHTKGVASWAARDGRGEREWIGALEGFTATASRNARGIVPR